jgi:hypothetical protein
MNILYYNMKAIFFNPLTMLTRLQGNAQNTHQYNVSLKLVINKNSLQGTYKALTRFFLVRGTYKVLVLIFNYLTPLVPCKPTRKYFYKRV